MTKDEILNLTPEQLRAEIAKRLGAYEDKNYHSMGGAMLLPSNGKPKFLWHLNKNVHSGEIGWDPTADISAAWELAEEIVSLGGYFTVDFDTTRNVPELSAARAWMCIMYTDPVKECLIAEDRTAPLAICRAWLMWKENEKEGEE